MTRAIGRTRSEVTTAISRRPTSDDSITQFVVPGQPDDICDRDSGDHVHPAAGWISRQLTEACGWDEAPRISSVTAPDPMARYSSHVFAPWHPRSTQITSVAVQNGYVERLIGSIRRTIDHVIVFGERHLRHLPRHTCASTTTRC